MASVEAPVVRHVSDGVLKFAAPLGVASMQYIRVQIANQPTIFQRLLSYDVPKIFTITPPNAPTTGGVNVTLIGENFGHILPSSISLRLATALALR